MKIAIIGIGNIGGTLAKGWAVAGHSIILGARNLESEEVKSLKNFNSNITASSIKEAISATDVVLVAIPAQAMVSFATENAEALRNKILIDATNSVFAKPDPYKNGFDALKQITFCNDVVKCFNSTGYENLKEPVIQGVALDMYMAGGSSKAKETATTLSKALGFEACIDFGGDDKVELLEQFAMVWINLAIMQKQGRGIAFKLLKR